MNRTDPLAGWFDDDGVDEDAGPPSEREIGPRPRRGLAVVSLLAAIAWIAAGAAWLFGSHGAGSPAEGQAIAVPSAPPVASEDSPPAVGSEAGTTASATSAAAGSGSPAIGDAGRGRDAAAVVAVHERVTADADDEAGRARWVDAAAVERWVQLPGPHDPAADRTEVAVVRALLLEGDVTAWDLRRQARYAIPIRCTSEIGHDASGIGDCTAAADPWPLPLTPMPSPRPSAAAAAGGASGSFGDPPGPTDEHVGALVAAGYTDVVLTEVRSPSAGVREVDILAVPPGGTTGERLRVWLQDTPRMRVIGMP